jgi:hypothetical protein
MATRLGCHQINLVVEDRFQLGLEPDKREQTDGLG